jgi:hypothetical protein
MAVNYIEHVVCHANNVYKLEKKEFSILMSSASKATATKTPPTKHFTRYLFEDMVYECSSADVRTYRKTPKVLKTTHSDSDSDKHIMEGSYNKEKIPFYMFPSTTSLYDTSDVSSTVFRVHNNVFINFEMQSFDSDISDISNVSGSGSGSETIYKVFVNYNVDPRDDPDTIKTVIDRTLGFLQWVK